MDFEPLCQGITPRALTLQIAMLNEEETKFIAYWEENRLRKKRILRNLAVGMPFGLILCSAILLNLFSSWYKKAEMVLNTYSSLFPVLLIAILLIIIFVTVFSARHKWDRHEQRYRELLSKQNKG